MFPIKFAEGTDIGQRHINQDFYSHKITDSFAFFVTADGLGGHSLGEVASKEFAKFLIDHISSSYKDIYKDPLEGTHQLFLKAGKDFQKYFSNNHPLADACTTCACVLLDQNQLITSHIGDSRIYRFDNKRLIWRSPDHTVVQELFEKGRISEQDMQTHPLQNVLLNTVNTFEDPQPEVFVQEPLEKDETIILCTDGFWANVPLEFIQGLIKTTPSKKVIERCISRALISGGDYCDNITVQIISLDKS